MLLTAIKLEFKTPLVISRGWGGYENSEFTIHSDTLKSAIYAVGLNLFPEWKNSYQEFNDSFFISSCFPFFCDEYFFPILYPDKNNFILPDDNDHKTIKKLEYVSKGLFEKLLKGEILNIQKDQIYNKRFLLEKNAVDNAKPMLFVEELQQRVTVSTDDLPKPYFVSRLHFGNNSGLFFLIDFKNKEIRNKIYSSLKLLGNIGIGTDRTVGNGFFDFVPDKHIVESFHINAPSDFNSLMCLGMYWPDANEVQLIDWNKSAWQIHPRGGFMAGSEITEFKHLFKKSVYMFAPGSIFQCKHVLKGKFDDLRPEWNDDRMHPVFRSGQPVFVPAVVK